MRSGYFCRIRSASALRFSATEYESMNETGEARLRTKGMLVFELGPDHVDARW